MPMSRRQLLKAAVAGAAGLAVGEAEAMPLQQRLRLAVAIQGHSPDSIRSEAAWARKAGFEHVQLNITGDWLNEETLRSAADIIKSSGLEVEAFGCYHNPLDPDNAGYMGVRGDAIDLLANRAGLFMANIFVTWSGGYHDRFAGSDPRNAGKEAMDALVERTEDLLKRTRVCMGKIAFEPFHPDILGTPARYAELFRRIRSSRVGMVMDPPNFVPDGGLERRNAIMQDAFAVEPRRVLIVHFKDIDADAEGRIAYPGPGDGKQDYSRFIRLLASLNRRVYCVIEHTSPDLIARHRSFILRAIDQVARHG